MGITEILRRILLFSANKIKSAESIRKQPTQLSAQLNSSWWHIFVTYVCTFSEQDLTQCNVSFENFWQPLGHLIESFAQPKRLRPFQMELGNFKDKRVGCLKFKKFNFINVDMSRHNYEFKRKKYYLQAMNKIEKKKSALEKLGHISSKFSKYIVSYSCDFTKHF